MAERVKALNLHITVKHGKRALQEETTASRAQYRDRLDPAALLAL